tara:strand:- start:207 stop:533 length:327 start_codon:yes stop_codon:yes gene_type:complete
MIMNESHVEASIAKIRAIFQKASARIEAEVIGNRQKIPATKLAEDLAKEFDTTGPALYPTIKFLLDGYPNVEIKRGAHGGISPLPLTASTKPATATATVSSSDTADDA